MKKIFITICFFLGLYTWKSSAQITPCSAIVNVEITALSPQSGPHNYFGVKVTLNQTYSVDVTVTGYIYDSGDPNTNHPFEVTVGQSNYSNQTASNFYETSPVAEAEITIVTITPVLLFDGQTYARTHGACGEVSTAFVDYTMVFDDSASAAYDFLYNIIPLNHEDLLSFGDSLVHNGIAATALAYNIDSNSIHAIVNKYVSATGSSFDYLKTSLFGSTPFEDLDEGQLAQLLYGEPFVNAEMAGRVAPGDLGGPLACLGSLYAGLWNLQQYATRQANRIKQFTNPVDRYDWSVYIKGSIAERLVDLLTEFGECMGE